MIKFIILFLLSIILMAQNPKVYSSLGDPLYDNIQNIENYQQVEEYLNLTPTVDSYIKKVMKIKDDGFSLQSGKTDVDKLEYLQSLRDLTKAKDSYYRDAESYFKFAVKNLDSRLFTIVVNSGLIDTQKYKAEIKEYYYSHPDSVNIFEVMQTYMSEDEKKERIKKSRKTKKQLEDENIKRIRENERIKKEKIAQALELEAKMKKAKIREEQLKELNLPN